MLSKFTSSEISSSKLTQAEAEQNADIYIKLAIAKETRAAHASSKKSTQLYQGACDLLNEAIKLLVPFWYKNKGDVKVISLAEKLAMAYFKYADYEHKLKDYKASLSYADAAINLYKGQIAELDKYKDKIVLKTGLEFDPRLQLARACYNKGIILYERSNLNSAACISALEQACYQYESIHAKINPMQVAALEAELAEVYLSTATIKNKLTKESQMSNYLAKAAHLFERLLLGSNPTSIRHYFAEKLTIAYREIRNSVNDQANADFYFAQAKKFHDAFFTSDKKKQRYADLRNELLACFCEFAPIKNNKEEAVEIGERIIQQGFAKFEEEDVTRSAFYKKFALVPKLDSPSKKEAAEVLSNLHAFSPAGVLAAQGNLSLLSSAAQQVQTGESVLVGLENGKRKLVQPHDEVGKRLKDDGVQRG